MESSLLRHVTLRQLRVLVVVGRELNLSRAAQILHTTQPAMSRALAQLESAAGTRLFSRSTKHMALTTAGANLLRHASRVLGELEAAADALRGTQGNLVGEVRVGCIAPFSHHALATALAWVRQRAPQVMFVVRTFDPQPLYHALLAGQVDLMLSHAEIGLDNAMVEVVPLYQEQCRVLVALQHPLARRRRVDDAALAALSWVLPPPDTPLRPKLNRLLSVHRRETPAVHDVETDSHGLALALVQKAGMAWAIAGAHARNYADRGYARVVDTREDILSGPMCAIHRRSKARNTATQLLLHALGEACAAGAPSA